MTLVVDGDVILSNINGEPRSLEAWTTNFHLAMIVLDPFTYESSWILDTAIRIFRVFREADCRACFLVTGDHEEARKFMGSVAQEFLVFADPDREIVKALELESLPAFVHINQLHAIESKAEGWDPNDWRAVAERLAKLMSWQRPTIPSSDDPVPFAGTPALG